MVSFASPLLHQCVCFQIKVFIFSNYKGSTILHLNIQEKIFNSYSQGSFSYGAKQIFLNHLQVTWGRETLAVSVCFLQTEHLVQPLTGILSDLQTGSHLLHLALAFLTLTCNGHSSCFAQCLSEWACRFSSG